MNRLTVYLEDPADDVPYGDFYVISGEFGSTCVTQETARYVERCLDECPMPAWIAFRDRAGSRIRVQSRLIRCIAESTAEQRAADRRLDRARRLEEKADRRPWESDEY